MPDFSRVVVVSGVRIVDQRKPTAPRVRPPKTKEELDAAYQRRRARWLLAYALTLGNIKRGPCEIGVDCAGPIDGHHEDYSKPFEVRWLCRRHHARHHPRTRKPMENCA